MESSDGLYVALITLVIFSSQPGLLNSLGFLYHSAKGVFNSGCVLSCV